MARDSQRTESSRRTWRGFYEGGPRSGSADWMDGVLSGDAIRERRAWVAGAVTSLLVPAVDFVRRQLP